MTEGQFHALTKLIDWHIQSAQEMNRYPWDRPRIARILREIEAAHEEAKTVLVTEGDEEEEWANIRLDEEGRTLI